MLVLPSLRQQVYRAVLMPMVVLALLSGMVGSFYSLAGMKALLAGGFCWFVPTLYMAYRLFHRIQPHAKQIVFAFFRTELEKLILVAILFIVIIKLSSMPFIGILVGYLLAQFSSWIVLAIGLQ